METVLTPVVVAFVFGPIGLGILIGLKGNPKTITTPEDAKSATDCSQACVAFDNARQKECTAKVIETEARNRATNLLVQMGAFIATAAALAAAGAAILAVSVAAEATIFLIPAAIALKAAAAALFTSSAAAFLYANFLAGEIVSASADANAKANAFGAWVIAVSNARTQVLLMCTPVEASACLSRIAPC